MKLSRVVQDTETSNAILIRSTRKVDCRLQLGAIGGEDLDCILSTIFQKGYVGRAPRSLSARADRDQSTDAQRTYQGVPRP